MLVNLNVLAERFHAKCLAGYWLSYWFLLEKSPQRLGLNLQAPALLLQPTVTASILSK